MHKKIITQLKSNVAVSDGVLAYFYDVKPINSLFTDEAQISSIVDLFMKKMIRINMPGQIIIRPVGVDVPSMVNYYNQQYKKGGFKPFRDIAKNIIKDIYQENKKVRYKYKVTFVFVESRDNFEVSSLKNLSLKKNIQISKEALEYAEDISDHLYNELNNGLSVSKLTEDEVESLIHYLAIPVKGQTESYFYTPQAQYMEYEYKMNHRNKDERDIQKLYTRNIMISSLPSEQQKQTNIFNSIQLLSFPVDIILKFDMVSNRKFVKKMRNKELDIEKSIKKEAKHEGFTSKEIRKKTHLAKLAVQGENADEKAKVKFQVMFRLRANSTDLLMKRYNIFQSFLGADTEREEGLQIAYDVGYQEEMYKNINPFDITYTKYVHTTDISYLAKFNWLGGLYIGEEREGMVLGYTRPGRIPVLSNFYAPIEGKSRKTAPITIIVGESGSGKTQLMNNIAIEFVAIYGVKIFIIDPKGDRVKFFDQIPPGMGQHLVLGGSSEQRGIFDPFNNYTPEKALEKARDVLIRMGRAINKNQEFNLRYIKEAYKDCVDRVKRNDIEKITMFELAQSLRKYDELWADNVLSLSDHEFGYLFFSYHDEEPIKFDLTYNFNLATFSNVPNLEYFDENNLRHQMFAILIEETVTMIDTFMRSNPNSPKVLEMDEMHVWNNTTNGESAVDNATRLARSYQALMILADQRYSTFNAIRDQASQVLIGSIASVDEIEEIIKYYKLNDNESIRNVLQDKTKAEGFEEDDLHRFLYIDYNNRKAVLRAVLHTQFKDAFDTRKKSDEVNIEKEEEFEDGLFND